MNKGQRFRLEKFTRSKCASESFRQWPVGLTMENISTKQKNSDLELITLKQAR